MDCILLRHGIAVAREEWSGEEAHRPLSGKGKSRTKQAAEGLDTLKLSPTIVLSSPLIRAHQTAEILRETLGVKEGVRLCDELIPDSPADKLLPLLATLPQDACVLCVGHEPLLGELAGMMLFGKPVAGLALRKAGACLIHFGEAPKAGRGVLEWWLLPSQLRTLRK